MYRGDHKQTVTTVYQLITSITIIIKHNKITRHLNITPKATTSQTHRLAISQINNITNQHYNIRHGRQRDEIKIRWIDNIKDRKVTIKF